MPISGFVQYVFAQSDDALTQYYLGRIVGGQWTFNENPQVRQGTGGQREVVGGPLSPVLVFTLVPRTGTIFEHIKRDTTGYPNSLPATVDLVVGNDSASYLWDDALCNSCRFVFEREGDLTLELQYYCTTPTNLGGASTPPSKSGATFVWYDGSVTVGGSGYQVQRAVIEVSNNLKWVRSLDSKTDGSRRLPDGIQAGDETVNVELTMLGDLGLAHFGDDLPTVSNVQIVASNGVNTITITVATVFAGEWSEPLQANDDLVVRTFRGQAEPNGGALTIAVT